MADYQEMYRRLFRATTKAIDILQKAQQETEELYIASNQPELRLAKERGPSQKDGRNAALNNQKGNLGKCSQPE